MERFINILVIDDDQKIRIGLKEILSGNGNNIMLSKSIEDAVPILKKKTIGITIINIDASKDTIQDLKKLEESKLFKNNYIILIADENKLGSKLVNGIKQGAIDYITHPFNPNLVRTKVGVYKTLFHKNDRITQLLSNVLPETIIKELSNTGKFSPKKVQRGVVLFTDFVDFSVNAKKMPPLRLIRKLERYFTKFDEIIAKYKLEKIKTIGDAYMAIAGVTEDNPEPAIRSALAALEIRNYIQNERDIAIAMKKDFWEIRIGMHMGPLVAGVIGSSKYSFDVWGDTVNIASRAESASKAGSITITQPIQEEIDEYFTTEPRGQIDIHKRGGSVDMYYLHNISSPYCLYQEGKYANGEIRNKCGLSSVDFGHARIEILNRLKSLLPDKISYHDISHTLNVEKAALQYAKLEGLSNNDILLLQTAVLFHDSGFIIKYRNNEDYATKIAQNLLPNFGYEQDQIKIITNIILSTKYDVEPETLLEKIMCDADHDYLGRSDYHNIASKLRIEMERFDEKMSNTEWINYQLDFLEKTHVYHTETVLNIRSKGKEIRIGELKDQLLKADLNLNK